MQKYVKEFGDERLTKVPADLDTKPYRDEHDTDLLRRMEKGIRGDKAPTGIDAPRLRRKIGTTMMELRPKIRSQMREVRDEARPSRSRSEGRPADHGKGSHRVARK